MGKYDLGINLAKEVSSYVNISKTKSILHTNPIRPTNLQGLKYAPEAASDSIVLSETQNFVKKLLQYSKPSKIRLNVGGIEEGFVKYEGSRMGTNPAFWAQNQRTGELFYVKHASIYGDARHLESEVTASKLYNLAGIKTPEMELGKLEDGTTCIISKFVPELKELSKAEAKEGFAADAWLANWDAVIHGNTHLPQAARCVKIDCGGALNYRALGKQKTNFGDKVEELTSLVDGRNYESTYFYGDMSQKALINSFKKVTSISDEAIRSVVSDEQLAQTLINRRNYMQRILNEIESTSYSGKDLAKYMRDCDKVVQEKQQAFLDNWNSVVDYISHAERKPRMCEFRLEKNYDKLSTEDKVLASYITEDFSYATNSFLRLGPENNPAYSLWADKGLDYKSIPKYKEALKYAMDGLESKAGTTFRWQPAGSFAKDFKVYQVGAEAPQPIQFGKSKGLFANIKPNGDGVGVPKEDPLYMSLKRSKFEHRKVTPQVGDVIEDPTFVSTGQNLRGLEEFRCRLFYDGGYQHPELVVIKGKNGKIILPELCGSRAYEKEVLYKADTKYKFCGEKEVTSPTDIEGFDQIIQSSVESHQPGFQPFKMIILEEV